MIALTPNPVRIAPTMAEWWPRALARKGELTTQTKRLYGETLARLVEHFGPDRRIDSLTRADAAEFVEWLARTPIAAGRFHGGLLPSDTTVKAHVKRCKAVLNLAVDLELIERNPFAKELSTFSIADVDFYDMTRDELERLIAALRTPVGPRYTEANGMEWGTLVALCRLAGLRRGEALRMTWADIDLERGTLTVRPQIRESGRRRQTTKQKRRVVPIEPRLAEILVELRAWQGPGATVLCEHVSTDGKNMFLRIGRAIKRAGIPKHDRMFHSMRKALENEWFSKGHSVLTVCRWLGHNPAVAAQHYHRPSNDEFEAVTKTGKPAPAMAASPSPAGDTDLQRIVAAWPKLSADLRAAMLAIAGTVQS